MASAMYQLKFNEAEVFHHLQFDKTFVWVSICLSIVKFKMIDFTMKLFQYGSAIHTNIQVDERTCENVENRKENVLFITREQSDDAHRKVFRSLLLLLDDDDAYSINVFISFEGQDVNNNSSSSYIRAIHLESKHKKIDSEQRIEQTIMNVNSYLSLFDVNKKKKDKNIHI